MRRPQADNAGSIPVTRSGRFQRCDQWLIHVPQGGPHPALSATARTVRVVCAGGEGVYRHGESAPATTRRATAGARPGPSRRRTIPGGRLDGCRVATCPSDPPHDLEAVRGPPRHPEERVQVTAEAPRAQGHSSSEQRQHQERFVVAVGERLDRFDIVEEHLEDRRRRGIPDSQPDGLRWWPVEECKLTEVRVL